jgi:hypothetical protein
MTDAPITPLQARIDEVAQYEKNIALYKSMLNNLPTEWPSRLEQYKGVTDKHAVIGKIADLDDVELLSDLWAAEDCAKAIRTETLEKRKAEAILTVLKASK